MGVSTTTARRRPPCELSMVTPDYLVTGAGICVRISGSLTGGGVGSLSASV
jgi:hypothetical protein